MSPILYRGSALHRPSAAGQGPAAGRDDGPVHPIRALLLAGGVARWRELADAGVSRGLLRALVEDGQIVRPHRGCYALPVARHTDIDATIFRGATCCVTSLVAHDVPVMPFPTRTHVAVPDSRSLARPGLRPVGRVEFHRSVLYPLDRMGELSVALDIASRCLEPAAQLAAIDGAVRAGNVGPEVIESFRDTSARRRQWLAARLDPSAESPAETLARVTMRDAGLSVVPQVHFAGVGRVDFLVERHVIVECDGRTYHSDPKAFQDDRDRDRALSTMGWSVLRYTYMDVLLRRDQIPHDVRAVLWRRGAESRRPA